MFRLLLARIRNRWVRSLFQGKTLDPVASRNLTALDHLDPRQNAGNLRYVVFDLETTGMNLMRDRVVSAAAFRVINARITLGDAFNSLVNPDRDIPPSAIKIHGIVPSMVEFSPSFSAVFDEFTRYLGTDILVGYNVRFDLHFINVYMKHAFGFPLQNLVLDTQLMCRKTIIPDHLRPYTSGIIYNRSLDEMAERFGIEIPHRHTAAGDALATAMIFQRILAELEKRETGLLRDLMRAGMVI